MSRHLHCNLKSVPSPRGNGERVRERGTHDGIHQKASSPRPSPPLRGREGVNVYLALKNFVSHPFPSTKSIFSFFVDHFKRASESVVLNLAEGARLYLASRKVCSLEYAIGSTLECAACLDIAAASTVKAAAYVDLYQQHAHICPLIISHGRNLLGRIHAMLVRF